MAFTYTINNQLAVFQTIEINDPRAAAFAHAGTRPSDFTAPAGTRNDVARVRVGRQPVDVCEILVVEGRVEASMKSRDIRIAEGGVFSGKAEIDVAEIRGTFEGELTARKRLVIYATGKVSGVIRYGAMMVEEGGTLSGDVATLSAGPSLAKVPDVSAPTTAPEPVEEKAAEQEPVNSG